MLELTPRQFGKQSYHGDKLGPLLCPPEERRSGVDPKKREPERAPFSPSGRQGRDQDARIERLTAEVANLRARLDSISSLQAPTPVKTADDLIDLPPTAEAVLHSSERRSPGGWLWELLAIALLLAVAIPLRFIHLASLPFGFHGDEAAMGIEAGRILHRGWIGAYSGEAGGTPAGPYYATAASIHFFGNTIFAARFASAALDTATVLLMYILSRRNFGRGPGLIAGLLTAVSVWQLEFARLAFITSAWPFCVVAGAIALGEAIRSGSRIWWLVCGALMASGLYAYPGHLLFLGVLMLFLAFIFIRSFRSWRTLSQIGLFVAGFCVAAWPLYRFVRRHPNTYFRTGRGVSIFESADWKSIHGRVAQADFLAHRYIEFWNRLILHPFPDGIDGTGAAPMVPFVLAMVCVAGFGFAWRRRKEPLVWFGALVITLMPWAVATSNLYPLRRALIMAPFIAMFAGIAIGDVIRLSWRRRKTVRAAGVVLALATMILIGQQSRHDYFNKTAKSSQMYWTLAGDLVHSVTFMQQLPPDAYVYFYAQRWPFEDAERAFLAPDVKGESRGAEFGQNMYEIDPAQGRPVVILVGLYKELLPAFQMMYPNSSFDVGPNDQSNQPQPSYIVFYPASPVPIH
jgi:4-amino-4-deoxy-L-arabinose transferase-like glycosyltransferase